MNLIDTSQAQLSPVAALAGEFVLPESTGAEESRATDAATERLAFRVGPVGLLCASDAGREVVLPPPVTRLPHLPVWMLGLTNVRGTLLPVVDLAAAYGVEREAALRRYLLVMGTAEDPLGLLVDGLPVIARFEAEERMRGVPPHPERLAGHVAGGYERDGVVWLDVDARGLFATLRNAAQIERE
jgi:chemotaxis signal transduction protein